MESIIGITPFGRADVALSAALCRARALAVMDVSREPDAASAIRTLASRASRFGIRVTRDVTLRDLPDAARVVVLEAGLSPSAWRDRTVLVEVTSIEEARDAVLAGAHGLIAKGNEAGGRVGDESSLILLQRILGEVNVPVWAQGGIGLHTAAACVAAGARGVVLDAQLALVKEASTPEEIRRVVRAMDGSETRIVDGRRIHARAAAAAAEIEIPVGQDGAFARSLAERFVTTEGVVRAITNAMAGHVRQARRLAPLAPRAPLAVAHGTEYPIAQGPMTRVSDQATFAQAVARAGALPFVALALMRGEEARTTLRETSARLAGRPWGVGVLGFVPPEIRDAQLAHVLEARPTVALVAGGRPSHARPLEAAGIATYLHVPSPGLLDIFLGDGARRFVFEGRECGGHVGPRSSFVLWEQAVTRLLALPDLDTVSVFFAGGLHDARSAAMVAALAAPLAARGAKIGVLMGTAYLFTEEAVATGAIGQVFQEEALRCDRTVLLETAPGHATRCADTVYAAEFAAERARLEHASSNRQEIWEALERFNLGRLRLASKGLRKEGAELVPVSASEQQRDGLFMIGQVATLRRARTTMAALHHDVSHGSREWLEKLELPTITPRRGGGDVAIVGMACMFPGAPDLQTFHKNIVLGANAIREVPRERWNPDQYYDPEGTGDATPSKWGGFLDEVPFDPAAHGIPPRSVAAIDPVQLLSLEVANRALEDAGYGAERAFDRERTSVIFGATSGTELANAYGFRASYPQMLGAMPNAVDAHLPRLTEDSFPGVLANVIAGRIANRLDLGGANYTVDAACASSLAAIELACKELASGTSDMVIAGGADVHNSINDYLLFASVHALSPRGQCRAFDASADGIVLGEGVAVVVLKRLADAEQDGDRIYAVIKGVGGSSDGKSLALTAPRKEGQARALERAYDAAGVCAADVGLVEAHGTGTVVGDKTELGTLTEVYAASGALPRTCTLGSVKSNIGHTKCAAGIAGVIKAALSVHHGVLPPTLHVEAPNPYYDPASSPFVFRSRASPWPSKSRVAAVSAFGFGGTNFHAVLASHPSATPRTGIDEWPAELFLVRGKDRAAVDKTLAEIAAIAEKGTHRLRDLARSVEATNAGDPVEIAIVASSLEDLREKLRAVRSGEKALGVMVAGERYDARAVAFLSPGQGSQRTGMLADLFVAFPELHPLLYAGERWAAHVFPPHAFSETERAAQKAALTDTRVAQPALGMVDLAIARLLGHFGVRPAMVAGHSYGELVALTVAGALDADALLAVSEARAHAILDAAGGAPGTMAAVSASSSVVRAEIADVEGVVVANYNAPEQTVIAGTEEAISRALARFAAKRISARKIPVACAFHSPIVARAAETFARHLGAVPFRAPEVAVYANATACRYPDEPAAVRAQLALQIAMPVRFAEMIEAMYADGARVFVEAGPGTVLGDLVVRILNGRPHRVVRCDRANMHGIEGLLHALGELAVAGIEVRGSALFERRGRAFDLASPPDVAPPKGAWMVNGFRVRPLEGELPDFALRIPEAPVSPLPAAAQEGEGALLSYLRNMRELVEAQRQVMMAHLGQSATQRDAVVAPAELAPQRPTESAPASLPPAPPTVRPPSPSIRPTVAPVSRRGRTTRPPPSIRPGLSPLEALIAAVSERTGYPPEMLDPGLDLEADLGIDSIKRIEILGMMRDALGLGAMNDEARSDALEELARYKTLREIAKWLEERVASVTSSAPAAVLAPTNGVSTIAPPKRADVARYVLDVSALPPAVANGVHVLDSSFAIVPDGIGVAPRLAELLVASGARVRVIGEGEPIEGVDGIIYLESIGGDPRRSPRAVFQYAQAAAKYGAKWLVAATGLGGAFGLRSSARPGGGVAGLLKSVAKERPDLRVCVIDLHPDEDPSQLAAHIFAELVASDAHVEIGYAKGVRQTVCVVEQPALGKHALMLDQGAVVLVTGGARGITAEVAIALARRYACRLELVGRTPIGPDEDEELARTDGAALRALLLARAGGAARASAAQVEREFRSVQATREIRRTLARIEAAGGKATYTALDVRDTAAFGAFIDEIYDRRGRLDGVIHGAGVIDDKLLDQKTTDSFERVFATKVDSALALGEKLRSDVRFVAFFSSVAGAFGNRGQTDYAAANDALDKLARHLSGRLQARVVSIGWGPWSGVGMVSPELEREYARRGVATISPSDGAERFVEELCRGSDAHVILAAPGLV